MNVYVVTNTEHGWDCVERVFSEKEKAEAWIAWWCGRTNDPADIFVIHEQDLDDMEWFDYL